MTEQITLEAFDELCKKFIEQKQFCDAEAEKLKAHNKVLEDLKGKLLALFEQSDKDKYAIKGLGTIYTSTRFTVTIPRGEEKVKFFDYLKARGTFEELVTVNHNTLNSWYQAEIEKELAVGNVDFQVPGIGEAKHVKTIAFRKG